MKKTSENCVACNNCRKEKSADIKIAVFGNETDYPASPHTADKFVVYARQSGVWKQTRTEVFPHSDTSSPGAARGSMENVIPLIDDCAAVAGATISGIPFSVFDKHGKHVFEIPEVSETQLTGIAEDIAFADARKKLDDESIAKAVPSETETPGIFYIDLIGLQKKYPELSSKMMLKQFLKNTSFLELIISCRHIPVWLEKETGYQFAQKQQDDHLIVSVIKKTCLE